MSVSAPIAPEAIIQQPYIAWYGRPADPTGLTYWQSLWSQGHAQALLDGQHWGPTAESQQHLGEQTLPERITQRYLQVLGRPPEPGPGALPYWHHQVESGAVSLDSLAWHFLQGVIGEDLNVLNARLEVAYRFTARMPSTSEHCKGVMAAAVARALLQTVTADPRSLANAWERLEDDAHVCTLASLHPSLFEQPGVFLPDGALAPQLLSRTLSPDNFQDLLLPPHQSQSQSQSRQQTPHRHSTAYDRCQLIEGQTPMEGSGPSGNLVPVVLTLPGAPGCDF